MPLNRDLAQHVVKRHLKSLGGQPPRLRIEIAGECFAFAQDAAPGLGLRRTRYLLGGKSGTRRASSRTASSRMA